MCLLIPYFSDPTFVISSPFLDTNFMFLFYFFFVFLINSAFTASYKLYLQIWYVVIRVLLDTSSRYEVVRRTATTL